MKWRPIKSAPKDRQILLACLENEEYGYYVTQGRWIDVPHTNLYLEKWKEGGRNAQDICVDPHWHDGFVGIMEHGGAGSGRTWEFRGQILFNPTHWMPLPEPPKRRKKSK